MIDLEPIRERFSRLSPHLDERGRRIFAAVEANARPAVAVDGGEHQTPEYRRAGELAG
jgi:hypothetical protein